MSEATVPLAAARARYTLPARAYTDSAVAERERREVFARAWLPLAHASELDAPGRYVTDTIAGEPVYVLRDADGVLRAGSNVCRHRAMTILAGAGSCPKVLRCPYHGWTYRHDGRLAAAPEARGFDDFDRDAVRLPQFRVEALGGLVWVSLDGDAEPLADWLGPLAEPLRSLSLGRLRLVERSVDRYPHNWKVVADNYLEGYHIPVGHPGLLRLLDYKRYRADTWPRGAFIHGPYRDRPSANRLERLYQRLARAMPQLPEELRSGWNYLHVWPATMVDIYPDQVDIWRVEPDGLRSTRTTSLVFEPPGGTLRDRVVRRINRRINRLVMDEDVTLCDGVQAGLESLTYERGVLNRNENAVASFHDAWRAAVPGLDDA